MRIAITSQNFRTLTGHAGKARRFLTYAVDAAAIVRETDRLDLSLDFAIHGFDPRQPHPLDGVDVLITGGCGAGFAAHMANRGIRVVTTAETDPEVAVHAFLAGCLKPSAASCHDHPGDPIAQQHGHGHDHGDDACGCHG